MILLFEKMKHYNELNETQYEFLNKHEIKNNNFIKKYYS